MDAPPAPLTLHRETVKPEWVDYNGHMNVAYYVLVFDHATDDLLDHIGLDAAYRDAHGGSVFVVEAHVTYENEVMEGDEVAVSTQILDADAKRMHVFHRMHKPGDPDGTTIATNELMILHMDMAERRSAAMPDAIQKRLTDLRTRHAALPHPPQAGRTIGIRRKPAP
jgi:acyl-CoA thioester hydrolase